MVEKTLENAKKKKKKMAFAKGGKKKQVIAIGKKTGCDVELHPEKK